LHVIDDILEEPLGGAHRDPREMGRTLQKYLLRCLRELRRLTTEELLEARYRKFRAMGVFEEMLGPFETPQEKPESVQA
jgi:acetyl-CoA carboxylase carboxyl transferase subunit alpha